jgi:hypothetical protein
MSENVSTVQATVKRPRRACGMLALTLAMLAFALAFLTDWGSYLNAPVPKTLVESASDAASGAAARVKDRVSGWFEDAPVPAPVTAGTTASGIDWNKRGKGIAVLLAVGAILLSAAGFVRHEPGRLITTALALSGAALAYQFVIKALIAMVAGLLIAAVLGRGARKD